jgi:GNAT superfamily N-acetyltransferase
MPYHVRAATLADLDVLVHHRIAMFTDMGITFDAERLRREFAAWLRQTLPSGTYRAWIAEADDGGIAGGARETIIPWPPGPQYPGDKLAFVYNVYTEHSHRRRGIARVLMEALHTWCRENGVTSVALNASRDGLPLYEALGYHMTPNPMMFFSVRGV